MEVALHLKKRQVSSVWLFTSGEQIKYLFQQTHHPFQKQQAAVLLLMRPPCIYNFGGQLFTEVQVPILWREHEEDVKEPGVVV